MSPPIPHKYWFIFLLEHLEHLMWARFCEYCITTNPRRSPYGSWKKTRSEVSMVGIIKPLSWQNHH